MMVQPELPHSQGPQESGLPHKVLDSETHHDGTSDPVRDKAATVIQRNYRGYRVRRQLRSLDLGPGTRWEHAISDARFQEINRPRPRHESFPLTVKAEEAKAKGVPLERVLADHVSPYLDPARAAARHRWKKAITVARRVGADVNADTSDDDDDESSSDLGRDDPDRMTLQQSAKRRRKMNDETHLKASRQMGLRYFLEMVDLKHRHGSNLGKYHQEWLKSDTRENFFYWLDHGKGKDVDLEICPREKLDRQQVRYLSHEERQHYLVKVDREGRLVWAKNGMRIDTTDEWKDTIHGIVHADDPTPAIPAATGPLAANDGGGKSAPRPEHPEDLSNSESDVSDSESADGESSSGGDAAAPDTEYRIIKRVKDVSAGTIFKRLIRKQPRKNTWLFVADTSFRLYVGIKSGGVFQHSSFLQGARISAAGLIKIRNGRITSLSPLSGHYRPPTENFRVFVHSLEDAGVDMSHVSITKSYAILVGLEAYVKTRQQGKKAARALKQEDEMYVPGRVPPDDKSRPSRLATGETAHKAETSPASRKEKTLKPVVRLLHKLGIHRRKSSRANASATEKDVEADKRKSV
ncbi:IQ calmodulin-binding motif [Microdochium nivale]|nr:IQ calmodulin-binding motif [Microdochium nivale]